MAFHEAFWAVVGGSAPVIALSAVLSISDVAEQRDRFGELVLSRTPIVGRASTPPVPSPKDPVWLSTVILFANPVQIANVCLQAVLLGMALVSLADQANSAPPGVTIGAEVAGLVLVAAAQYAVVRSKTFFRMEQLRRRRQ